MVRIWSILTALVALRKESVDRNCELPSKAGEFLMSLSARRAWIEIYLWVLMGGLSWSLSARRAWIEIAAIRRAVWAYYVALRKESVDRNWVSPTRLGPGKCRSPQGERG